MNIIPFIYGEINEWSFSNPHPSNVANALMRCYFHHVFIIQSFPRMTSQYVKPTAVWLPDNSWWSLMSPKMVLGPVGVLPSLKWNTWMSNHIPYYLTHWPLGDFNLILGRWFSRYFIWMVAEVSLVKLPSDECHKTLLMISQHLFRQWLGAVRQQAITCTNVDPDLCRQMASLGLNELRLPSRH